MKRMEPLEEALLRKAKSLQNGCRGDLGVISEVLSDVAQIVLQISYQGCRRADSHGAKFGWPACVAFLGVVIPFFGLIIAILVK